VSRFALILVRAAVALVLAAGLLATELPPLAEPAVAVLRALSPALRTGLPGLPVPS
jgi:hypothetical protein